MMGVHRWSARRALVVVLAIFAIVIPETQGARIVIAVIAGLLYVGDVAWTYKDGVKLGAQIGRRTTPE